MKKAIALINGAARNGKIGNYKWIFVQINGRLCWKTEEQLRKMGVNVKFRSARQ